MVPLLVLVFGVIQYGLYFWAQQAGTNATGEVLRRLSVGDCQDHDELVALLEDRLGFAVGDGGSVTATVVYDTATPPYTVVAAPGEVGGTVDITVAFDAVDLGLPFIPMPGGGEITRHQYARVEDLTPRVGGCA